MRKFFIVGSLALFFLSACSHTGPLKPEDVIKAARAAVEQMQSADFDFKGTVDNTSVGTFDIHLHGLMFGNKEAQFAVAITKKNVANGQEQIVTLQGDAIARWQQELFLKLGSFTSTPKNSLADAVNSLSGAWWRFPLGAEDSASSFLTPDPQLMQAQTDAIMVTRDRGILSIHGRNAYRYDVTLDPMKLRTYLRGVLHQNLDATSLDTFFDAYTVTGEIWIDATTFYIHELTWTVEPKESGVRAHIQMELKNHDVPSAITPPTDIQPFPIEKFLPLFTGTSALLPISFSGSLSASIH
jgi:hypothetical protein